MLTLFLDRPLAVGVLGDETIVASSCFSCCYSREMHRVNTRDRYRPPALPVRTDEIPAGRTCKRTCQSPTILPVHLSGACMIPDASLKYFQKSGGKLRRLVNEESVLKRKLVISNLHSSLKLSPLRAAESAGTITTAFDNCTGTLSAGTTSAGRLVRDGGRWTISQRGLFVLGANNDKNGYGLGWSE